MSVVQFDPNRGKALESALGTLRKRFGDYSVMRMDGSAAKDIDVVPTGSLLLDKALGIGGWPRGRVVEIFGPESSGKTTLTLHAIAEVQRAGGTAAFVDAEHALDPTYARALGVDLDSLLVSQPDSGEQALEIAETLVRSGAVDLVVIDSVAALVPQAEIQGEMGDTHVGLQARLMSQALRKITSITARTQSIVMFVNQVRQKIGVMFGNGEVTTGGNALKFYASIRVDIRRIGGIKEGDDLVGNRTKIKVVKNKLAPPFRVVETEILYGHGLDPVRELVLAGTELGLIQKSGSWLSVGEHKWQGARAAREGLLDLPAVREELAAGVRGALGLVEDVEIAEAN